MDKVLVAMSGGVDSSVAALLLQRQGCDVSGATFLLFDHPSAHKNVADAQAVCRHLGIPHTVFSYIDPFRRHVLDYFCDVYRQGHTPNPCVACNMHIKFGRFLQDALDRGFSYVSTGHYAQVSFDQNANFYRVSPCSHTKKDQSYVLYHLSQHQLSHILLPLSHLDKSSVRQIARDAGLPVAEKSDSQDICFVENGKYAQFLETHSAFTPQPGRFLDLQGDVLGSHPGYHHFTLGQRRGLGISLGKRQFVLRIEPRNGDVTLGDEAHLFRAQVELRNVVWQLPALPEQPLSLLCKLRYAHTPAPCTAYPLSDDRCRLVFAEPQRAPTPGQSAVFYRDGFLLGGGEILPEEA